VVSRCTFKRTRRRLSSRSCRACSLRPLDSVRPRAVSFMPPVKSIYDNADVVSPRLVASRVFGASTVVADAEAWKVLKEPQA
jgi:hypothetical protein